ncbi:MAG: ATP-binding protein [Methanoregula sp.]|nr:ATP-binding protein [Methanoregula sp.]
MDEMIGASKITDVLNDLGLPNESVEKIMDIICEKDNYLQQILNSKSKTDIEKIFNGLIYTYIAQKIKSWGVLGKNIPELSPEMLKFLEENISIKYKKELGKVYVLTKNGENIAKIIEKEFIFQLKPDDFTGLNTVALLYLLDMNRKGEHFNNSNSQLGEMTPSQISNTFLEDCKKVMDFFKERKLSAIADNYVTTKEGRIDESTYLLAPDLDPDNLKDLVASKKLQSAEESLQLLENFVAEYNALNALKILIQGCKDKNEFQIPNVNKELQANLVKILNELKEKELIVINGSYDLCFINDKSAVLSKIQKMLQITAEKIQEASKSQDSIEAIKPGATIRPVSPVSKTKISQQPVITTPEQIKDIDKTRLNIFLGKRENGTDAYWSPGSMNNGHMIILGGSGAGKTTTIQRISFELNKNGYPVLLIDFHGDMAFGDQSIKTYKINEKSESFFNPLELNQKFPDITPLRARSDFVDAIVINSHIGVQQSQQIKDLIKQNFEDFGITDDPKTWKNEFKFDKFGEILRQSDDKTVKSLKAYFDDIVSYRLFEGTKKISIKDLLDGGITHINLVGLPESLRPFYADLFLRKLYYSLQSLGEIKKDDPTDRDKFRIFVIIDEAKLLVSEKKGMKAVLNKYATELRKFGAGVIMASQIINHFNDEILAIVQTQFCMKAETKKDVKKIASFFSIDSDELLNLHKGEGIFIDNNSKNRIRITPLKQRKGEDTPK